jgi:hypothetical protein
MAEEAHKTWVLTGSLDNFRATRDRDFRIAGMKERQRRRATEEMAPGDLIVYYVTVLKAFGAIARITGEMYEDRSKVWPGKPGKPDPYPWRFVTEPVLVLGENEFVPAEDLVGELEHIAKWPVEHWTLAFQGQLRTVSDADRAAIEERMRAAAAAGARAAA